MEQTKKIACLNCGITIGFIHHNPINCNEKDVVVPNENGIIKKVKFHTTSTTQPYGNMETEIKSHIRIQLECSCCNHNKTILLSN